MGIDMLGKKDREIQSLKVANVKKDHSIDYLVSLIENQNNRVKQAEHKASRATSEIGYLVNQVQDLFNKLKTEKAQNARYAQEMTYLVNIVGKLRGESKKAVNEISYMTKLID